MLKQHIWFWICFLMIALPLAAGQGLYPVAPAGAEIAVELEEAVDSESATAGDTFKARIKSAVEVDGQTVIPAGAPAKVALVATPETGPGGAKIYAIELKEIEVAGKRYPVVTGYAETEPGRRKVKAGEELGKVDVPGGTTETDDIIAATAQKEGAAVATVHGAGVVFQVVQGPEVDAGAGATVYFTLAELLALRPEEALPE